MNFLVPDEPARRAVVSRDYWGVNDGLVSITLECGHALHGLATWPAFQGDVLDCWACVVRLEGDDEPKQLSLFEAGVRS